ncbi:hypothetical protein PsorP6_006940 [Peronosclerospora sorghi]|uniref:Uncharacterized protein n=1 Tax=Peronosclerospora sorghi TaxID=230839 RepID=A0ACC0WE23_9STRA|nr:hypothetical protein PsorP6_006940 [Peronosclerospora sorghi]
MTLDGFINGSGKRLRATEVAVVERKTFKDLLALCNPKTSTMLIKHHALADRAAAMHYYFDMLEKLGLTKHHGHVTVDNGSYIKALLEAFEMRENVEFSTEQMMQRCMAHVLNLISRDGLHEFGHVEDDEDNVEETYIMRINTIVDKPDGADLDIGTVYGRIKNLAKHVAASPQRRKELSCAVNLRQSGSTVDSMLSDVTTRWNSTYLMLGELCRLSKCGHPQGIVHSTYGARQLQPVAVAMHSKLKKYVKLAFQQDANYFATILDPRWNIIWFRDQKLPDAIDLLFTEAADKFKKLSEEATSPPPPLANNTLEAMMEYMEMPNIFPVAR